MIRKCFHLFLIILFFYYAPAQENLLFKTFSFNQGLNSYNIYKTRQDKYGFIWIATQDGVFRFNGRSFEVIKNNTGSVTATMGNVFLDMEIGDDNNIYAADYYYGIDIIKAATWDVNYIGGQTNKLPGALPNYWIEKISVDTKLNLWVGGKGYIAFKRKNETEFIKLNTLPDLNEDIRVKFIKQVSTKIIAIGIENYGLLFYDIESLTQCNFIALRSFEFDSQAVNNICLFGDTLFAITNTSITKGVLVEKKWKTLQQYKPAEFKNLLTTSIVHDKKAGLWIGTNAGIVYFNESTLRSIIYKADKKKPYWLKDNFINDLFIDRQDNLWISTFNVLQMVNLNGNQFKSYSGDESGSDYMEHIYSIVKKNRQEIFCTGTDGLYITNLETGSTKKISGSNTLGLIHHIEKIEEDFWIVSATAGMYAYKPATGIISQKSLFQKFPEWEAYRQNYFNTAFKKDSIWYWASEENEGLIKWDMKSRVIKKFKAGSTQSSGLVENHIRNLKKDQEGFLWILSDATVSKFNLTKDTVEEVLYFNNNNNTPNASLYFDMYDDGNNLWFASYGAGVCGYNKKTKSWSFISEQNGLCNNSVYGILPENDSIFWVSTNMGLSRVNHYTKNCSNYFLEDGLQDNSFDEKGVMEAEGKLLFGGINGFTAVDLKKHLDNSNNFPVFIYKIEYVSQNKKFTLRSLDWNNINFPTNTNSIEIFLAALTFPDNHKVKFSYKIEGIHTKYLETGNSIILNALGYGKYNVFISYRKPNGIFVKNALQISIYIQPKWYQTWWFKLLVFLTTASIIYAFYRYRIGQIKKQHEIRKNIATDLHDDLGSTLNSVKVFTNLAISGVKQEESLQHIKENLNEATMGLRDMIWVLDDSLDTVDELATRIKQYALPVADASNIEVFIKADSDVNRLTLTKEEKRNLFLICKEAINNSIKYAGASQINVDIKPCGKKIQIGVVDNGKGFNVDEVKKGYGLKNMQHRAGQIKYGVRLVSATGTGTQIVIQPL